MLRVPHDLVDSSLSAHVSLWRMYIDEIGDHVMSAALVQPQRRYLSLTGVWIDREAAIKVIRPEMEALKRKHFNYDRDAQLILHRNDIVRRSGKFWIVGSGNSCRSIPEILAG